MKSPVSDITRLQNTIDGLEKLVLESTIPSDELDSAEMAQTESAIRNIFAASAARAKLAADSAIPSSRSPSRTKTKRPTSLAIRVQEMAAMLLSKPDLEPRLRAVFESSEDVGSTEIDKVIEEVGNLLVRQDNEQKRAKSKKSKALKQGE